MGINYCNVTPFLYRIVSFQNIICNIFVPNGKSSTNLISIITNLMAVAFVFDLKVFFCGNPSEAGGNFTARFLSVRWFLSPPQGTWIVWHKERAAGQEKYNTSNIYPFMYCNGVCDSMLALWVFTYQKPASVHSKSAQKLGCLEGRLGTPWQRLLTYCEEWPPVG